MTRGQCRVLRIFRGIEDSESTMRAFKQLRLEKGIQTTDFDLPLTLMGL